MLQYFELSGSHIQYGSISALPFHDCRDSWDDSWDFGNRTGCFTENGMFTSLRRPPIRTTPSRSWYGNSFAMLSFSETLCFDLLQATNGSEEIGPLNIYNEGHLYLSLVGGSTKIEEPPFTWKYNVDLLKDAIVNEEQVLIPCYLYLNSHDTHKQWNGV